MSCVLDTNKGTVLVLEHHHIHVTHTQYRFPQAYDMKKHPLQYFCKHSTYQYVQSTYLRKIVRTKYVLVVQSTYSFLLVHTHTNHTHTSFPIRNHRSCDPHESPSDAYPTLCWQHPAYPKSTRLPGRPSVACHVQTATATC
jgi:hypothetical protein